MPKIKFRTIQLIAGGLISALLLFSLPNTTSAQGLTSDFNPGSFQKEQLPVVKGEKPATTPSDPDACGIGNVTQVGACLKQGLAWLGSILLYLFSLILFLAAALFDFALDLSIISFTSYANSPGITTVWQVSRDVANMFFIFIMLYIAIGTVAQIDGINWQKMVRAVIIAAVMVNFSALAAKLVIDPTNIIAAEFYGALAKAGNESSLARVQRQLLADKTVGSTIKNSVGIAGIFVDGMKLTSIYDIRPPNQVNSGQQGSVKIAEIARDGGQIDTKKLSLNSIIISTFGGIFLIINASFVFFAGAVLFVIRTIVLLLLIAVAPLAFLMPAIPGMEKHWKKWFGMLIDQSLYAPVYLFSIYMVAQIIHARPLGASPNSDVSALAATVANSGREPSTALGGLLDWTVGGSVNTLMFFILINGFMLAALYIAKEFGAMGMDSALKFAGWATNGLKDTVTGAITQNRLVKPAGDYIDKKATAVQNRLARINPTLGRTFEASKDFLSSSQLSRASEYAKQTIGFSPLLSGEAKDKADEADVKAGEKAIKGTNKDNFNSLYMQDADIRKKAYRNLSNQDRVKIINELKAAGEDGKDLLKEFEGYEAGVGEEDKQKIRDIREKMDAEKNRQITRQYQDAESLAVLTHKLKFDKDKRKLVAEDGSEFDPKTVTEADLDAKKVEKRDIADREKIYNTMTNPERAKLHMDARANDAVFAKELDGYKDKLEVKIGDELKRQEEKAVTRENMRRLERIRTEGLDKFNELKDGEKAEFYTGITNEQRDEFEKRVRAENRNDIYEQITVNFAGDVPLREKLEPADKKVMESFERAEKQLQRFVAEIPTAPTADAVRNLSKAYNVQIPKVAKENLNLLETPAFLESFITRPDGSVDLDDFTNVFRDMPKEKQLEFTQKISGMLINNRGNDKIRDLFQAIRRQGTPLNIIHNSDV